MKPGRILVVDDDSSVRQMVIRMLAAAGYEVVEAEDGAAAYELIQQVPGNFRLVITDIRMPGMDGVELTRRLRLEYPEIPVLCISGYVDQPYSRAEYFLAKPFTHSVLMAMVGDVIGDSPEGAAADDPPPPAEP
jgi:CheY-like chemotaxis protein